ncbi:hypothetical protein DFH07DRAFT_966673 [Mycena maculata]|uniref:Uncharacterized protein n=1 Tax=Mycena maculata TaxID=230809 RepID=A0AAD7I7T2_9AGAR|nr:hypothetical protein DFH07DRAFT_966673 [Mycena maculata]
MDGSPELKVPPTQLAAALFLGYNSPIMRDLPPIASLRCRLALDDVIGGGVGVAPDSSSPLFRIDLGAALVIVPLALLPLCEVLVLVIFCFNSWCCRRSAMPKDVSKDDPGLPFPGEYGPEGFAVRN